MDDLHDEFADLLDRLRAGDEEAARQLVSEYGHHVRAVIRRKFGRRLQARLDSSDIAQNVWKSFFRTVGDMPIEMPGQLFGILMAMAEHKLCDAYRQHVEAAPRTVMREAPRAFTADGRRLRSRNNTPSQFAIARERLQNMLGRCSPTERRIIQLRLDGHSFAEIASALGIDERVPRRVIDAVSQRQHC